MAPPMLPLRDRLLARIEKHPTSGCWLWTGSKDRDGYGVLGIHRNKQHRAHRVAYEVFVGEIPAGHFVCHRCDVPACINPDHLFVGTPRDNTLDMLTKQRKHILRGEKHPIAKLTDDHVRRIRELRASGMTLAAIGWQYNISFQYVSALCKGARS